VLIVVRKKRLIETFKFRFCPFGLAVGEYLSTQFFAGQEMPRRNVVNFCKSL